MGAMPTVAKGPPGRLREALEAVRADTVQRLVREALKRHRGNVTAAAAWLGVPRARLHKLCEDTGFNLTAEAKKHRE